MRRLWRPQETESVGSQCAGRVFWDLGRERSTFVPGHLRDRGRRNRSGRGQKTSVGRAAFVVVRRGRRARGTDGGLFQVLRTWEMEAKGQRGRKRRYLVLLNIQRASRMTPSDGGKSFVLGAEAAAIVDGETGRYVGPGSGTARKKYRLGCRKLADYAAWGRRRAIRGEEVWVLGSSLAG